MAAVLDLSTGQLTFVLPVKSFIFKHTLMQEHFNENYRVGQISESHLLGRFVGLNAATLATAGAHAVRVEGALTLHGVTHRVQVPASLELLGGLLALASPARAQTDLLQNLEKQTADPARDGGGHVQGHAHPQLAVGRNAGAQPLHITNAQGMTKKFFVP